MEKGLYIYIYIGIQPETRTLQGDLAVDKKLIGRG